MQKAHAVAVYFCLVLVNTRFRGGTGWRHAAGHSFPLSKATALDDPQFVNQTNIGRDVTCNVCERRNELRLYHRAVLAEC
jgi:hypothetical protein